jgi:hypothetical protein
LGHASCSRGREENLGQQDPRPAAYAAEEALGSLDGADRWLVFGASLLELLRVLDTRRSDALAEETRTVDAAVLEMCRGQVFMEKCRARQGCGLQVV